MSFTESKICKRRWWHGAATFLPQESCAALNPVSPESHRIGVSSFSHLCQQPPQSSGHRLSKPWLVIYCDLKILLRSLTKVFHKVILGAGEKEIPALHLSLDQASLPTKWSVFLGILCPCLSLLEVFSCELHGG